MSLCLSENMGFMQWDFSPSWGQLSAILKLTAEDFSQLRLTSKTAAGQTTSSVWPTAKQNSGPLFKNH